MLDHKGSEKGSHAGELCGEPNELLLSAGNDSLRGTDASGPREPLTFMDMPLEIRKVIYKHTLANPDGMLIIGSKHCTERGRRRAILGHKLTPFLPLSEYPREYAASTRNPAILRVNKTIYGEAVQILYGEPIVFTEMVALQSFLANLSQEKISLLRRVAVDDDIFGIYGDQQDFMPSVFALLKGADKLESLRIPDIAGITAVFHTCIDGDHDAEDDTISIACFDSVVARNLAAEVYSRLYTYLRAAIPARGIDKIMEVLSAFEDIFDFGHDHVGMSFKPAHVEGVEWTEERKLAMKKVMGQQIERLVEADKN